MFRMRMCLAVAALAVASFLSTSSLQAGDAIKMVPADALGLVVIDRLDALDAKVGKATEGLGLPLPGPLMALQFVPGLTDCLDKESPIVAAVLKGAEPGDDPVVVAYVPVKDFEAFTKLLGGEQEDDVVRLTVPAKPMLVAEKDGYALLVPEDEKQVLTRALESKGGLAKVLDDDLAWVEQRDVAAVMTDTGISVFCDKLVEGIEVAQQAVLAQGNDQLGAAEILNVYKKAFALIDQELESAAVGLDVQESGDLVLRVRKRFLPAGQFAQCLAVSALPSDMLAGLPTEPFVMAGGSQFSPAMGKLMMDYSVEVMKAASKLYGISEEQAEQMLESSAPMMADMQSLAMMFTVGSPDDTIYARMVGVMKTGNAQKYMEAYEKYLLEFSEMMKNSKGIFSMAMDSKPLDIDGCKGVVISMKMPEKLLGGAPNAAAMVEKMIGPDGKVRVFVVAADEHNVLLGYTNKKLLRKAIAALRSGESVSQEESVKQTGAKLDAGNFGQGYFSPAGLIDFINDTISTVGGDDQEFRLPAFPKTPPVAWSANAEGATVDAQIVVPGEMIKAGFGYAAQVQQAFQPRQE